MDEVQVGYLAYQLFGNRRDMRPDLELLTAISQGTQTADLTLLYFML